MDKYRQSPRIVALVENNPYTRDPRVQPHAEALAVVGYQVTAICPRGQDEPWRESINGVQVYRFPNPACGTKVGSYLVEFFFATLVMTLLTLWVWVRQGLDVLLIYNPPDSLFVAGLLPKLLGKTIVYDLRDLSPELYESKFENVSGVLYRFLLWLERSSCRLADRVIVVNESYRRVVMERDGVLPEQVSVVRQGPDLSRVHSTEPDPELRARAKTILAFLGHMAKQDGIDHLFWALHHLDRRFGHTDLLCVLIGPVDEPQVLEDLAAELGVSDRIWFTGYLSYKQWVPILSTADICVEPCPANPVNNISTMNKLMDYMALAKPVVAYDLLEHRVTAGEAALYAQPNDAVDMARQIARLIEEPELRIRLGSVGRKRIAHHLAWEHQRERLLTIYEGLLPYRDTGPQSGSADKR